MNTRLIAGLLLSTALATACASLPPSSPKQPVAAPESLASPKSFSAPQAAWPADRWWEAYGDAQLTGLIDEALAGSPSLAAAAARVRQAQAVRQQAGAPRYPTANFSGSTNASKTHLSADNLPAALNGAVPNDWTDRSNATLQIQYALDFFGRNRAAFAAATSDAQAAAAEAAQARLTLSTSVALTYAELGRLYADRAAASEAVRLRGESVKLVHQRLANGLENEGQASQSDSELAQANAELIAVDGSIATTRNALAALLGKGPDRGLDIAVPQAPKLSAISLPGTIGLDLIGRRPDLAAARSRVEAAAKRIDVARADFYPNVNLVALAGIQTLGIDQIGGGLLSFGQVGPAVTLPIFSGGRLQGAYRGARAEYDVAAAEYNQTLADAFRDVADALSGRRTLEGQLVQSRAALDAAEQAYRVAQLRYSRGLSSYIDVLTIQNSLIAAQRQVADLTAQAFSLDITMIRALGGGYQTPSANA